MLNAENFKRTTAGRFYVLIATQTFDVMSGMSRLNQVIGITGFKFALLSRAEALLRNGPGSGREVRVWWVAVQVAG